MNIHLDEYGVKDLVMQLGNEDLMTIEMIDVDVEKFFEENGTDMFVVDEEGVPVGFFAIHRSENVAQTPMFLLGEYRGRGYGKKMVDMIEAILWDTGVQYAMHRIKKDNGAMLALSRSCGYEEYITDGEYIIMMKEVGG